MQRLNGCSVSIDYQRRLTTNGGIKPPKWMLCGAPSIALGLAIVALGIFTFRQHTATECSDSVSNRRITISKC